MKILHVIPVFFFPELMGGSQTVLYQISKQLVERGHDVTIYTSDLRNWQGVLCANRELLDGIEIVRFKSDFPAFSKATKIILSLEMVKAFAKQNHKFDIVHFHEVRSFQNLMGYLYCSRKKIPYIMQAHGILGTPTPSMNEKIIKYAYDQFIGHRMFRKATKVIAINDREASQYSNIGISSDKIQIVPNGLDISEFRELPPKGEFKNKWGLTAKHRLILYLGRIHPIKGLDLLARAFAKFVENSDNSRLVIAGPDDGYMHNFQKLIAELNISDKVLITGPLYGVEKLKAYVDADVFVNPCNDEIFGIVFLEALLCGTPVISSEGCGLASIINKRCGLAVPYDEIELKEAIQIILSDECMRQEFGDRGKHLVREQFDLCQIASILESIYQNCSYT